MELRTVERDLYDAAEEIRNEDIPEARARKEQLEAEIRREFDGPEDTPAEYQAKFEQSKSKIRELEGTAQTFEHYADQWSDGETCVFVLEELNGDEFARTIDAVSAEAQKQARQDGDLPDGFGKVKSLEFGVEEKPDGAPADPGQWPAAIIGDLFDQLNQITAPSGVDLGNESLSDVFEQSDNSDSPEPVTATTDGKAEN